MATFAHSTPAPRRDILKILGVTSLPAGISGALVFSDKTDMSVISAAREAARLRAAHREARNYLMSCEEVFNAVVLPPEPLKPDSAEGLAAVSDAMASVLRRFPALTGEVETAAAELRTRTVEDMWVNYRAWLMTWEQAAAASGINAADLAYDEATDALVSSVLALADTKATTLEGLLAKAAVFEEDPHDDQLDTHQQALALSVLRDLQAMTAASS